MRSARGELGVTEYILGAGCSISKRLPLCCSYIILISGYFLNGFGLALKHPLA